jgi:NAD+ kinase
VRALGLVMRPERDLSDILDHLADWAQSTGVALVGPEGDDRLPGLVERVPERRLAARSDVVVALGGDGTVLGAMRLAAPHAVPVLGINLGTLGYLAECDVAGVDDALTALLEGQFSVEPRTGLRLSPVAGTTLVPEHAFNDVVFSRVPGRGQAALGLRVDGELLVRYSSDGVIVATAQGSTAYSFAAGGPLVSPRAEGMVVTPDAPHGLFNRAVVLAERELLTVEVLPRSAPLAVEIDGQLCGYVEVGARLDICSYPAAVGVVRVRSGGFAERARRKLGIVDPAHLADYDFAGHER